MHLQSPGTHARTRPVAVIDIGSNSVRMVVYSGLSRTPVPMFNEKAVCALGKGLKDTQRLNPDGVIMALDTLARFEALATGMGVSRIDALATAAVREAEDGAEFVQAVENRTGLKVRVLPGEDEAKLSAFGVLCSVPGAQGLVADLGGGSLDLVRISDGEFHDTSSLALGILRLDEAEARQENGAKKLINDQLNGQKWLSKTKGQDLYLCGGAWRSLARVCIAHKDYPLHVLDNFTLSRSEAEPLLGMIAHLSRKTLEQIPGVSKRRLPTLHLAAKLLQRLVEETDAKSLIFSVYGMREGQFYAALPPELAHEDPLLSAAADLARSAGRFVDHGHEVMKWMSPLFPKETPAQTRLRHAACLMGDVFWIEHPDYRAEQAFLRILRLPFMGLSHVDRAGLALAIYHRYNGTEDAPVIQAAFDLLDEQRLARVKRVGQVLRLGFSLSGGTPGILPATSIEEKRGVLTLTLPGDHPAFGAEIIERRFQRLADALEFKPSLVRT